MSKIYQDNPCPCGSEKRYKSCCGKNVIEFPTISISEEAAMFQNELLKYTLERYETEILDLAFQYPLFDFTDVEEEPILVETHDTYMQYMLTWAVFNLPIAKGQTIFEEFYRKESSKIVRKKMKNLIQSWRGATPKLYLLKTIYSDRVVIEDILGRTEYELQLEYEKEMVEENSLLLGMLLDMGSGMDFLGDPISFPAAGTVKLVKEFQDELEEHLEDGGEYEDFYQIDFPYILERLLLRMVGDIELPDITQFEWSSEKELQVAILIQEHMRKDDCSIDMIMTAIVIWKSYCEKESPSIRKLEVYAASIDYLVQSALLDMLAPSQKEIADKYEISEATVSKLYKKIGDTLYEELEGLVMTEEMDYEY
ncbi:SEC-C metal-binding domain-containing protein [Peribacillus loiseleuriae]|uniref:cyclin family protein n=1 Tax=Peribacillus loiseleuriae TaxID=1679170 RepID=UPI003CFC5685